MTYDKKVYQLVLLFLDDLPIEGVNLTEKERQDMADQISQDVQREIEDGMEIARARHKSRTV